MLQSPIKRKMVGRIAHSVKWRTYMPKGTGFDSHLDH
jgi:hypothetical protein